MDETTFIQFITHYLNQLTEKIEDTYWAVAECEQSDGVVKIQTEGKGIFIINRNIPRQELWLSSPFSGGAHFVFVDGQWVNTRTHEPFEPLLFSELDQLVE
jgi:frataxin